MSPSSPSLINVDDSVLIVIDVQEAFLKKLPKKDSASLVERICWLIRVATHLSVPIVVTAEDMATLGDTVPQVSGSLPPQTEIFNKMIFGLAAQEDIMTAIEMTGCSTAVLVGLETDVCVAQSALGLMDKGYKVVVVQDATGSPESGHEFGITRMRGAGVVMSSVKGLFYEWLPTVEGNNVFLQKHGNKLGNPGVKL
mmetsp:Transcript_7981/g.12330  ORF Transcript_7981/g.12330 Transcript_7981/m.12330 type:complete len:197 (+) Transcript_7981:151-741(+)